MTTTKNNEHKKLNAPNLRFPEFEGEWEEYRIEDITENISSGRCKSHSSSGKYNLYGSTGIIGKTNEACYEGNLVLVARVGANAGSLQILNEPCGITDNTLIIKPKEVDAQYIYYFLQHFNLNRLIFGSGQPLITGGMLKKVKVSLGTIQEQNKITRLLSLLDERIATQNKVIDKLQSLIKGIAHKISKQGKPNIRLSECLECSSTTLQESDVAEVGAYPVYGANGIVGYLDTYSTTKEAIYIIKDGSGVGSVSYVKGKCSATGTLNILQAKEGYSLRYLYFMLKVFNFEPYKTGMAIPHIYFKDYRKAKIYCPSYELQVKYTDLLFGIEQKAITEQKILTNLYNQKQYLLRQMFI
ncbi:MAG: restriction endonuclease subunit S [Bacteroidales bacterium]|nr:restriction endonuclease subunit S [Bacteroidales bacterium]